MTIFDIGNSPAQRQHVEAARVDGFGLGNRRLGRLAIALVELEPCLQQMRIDDVGVELERLLDRFFRRWRIHVEQCLCHSDERWNPFVVDCERILE